VSGFGTLKNDTALEESVIGHLTNWLPTYLPEVARQDGSATIVLPKSFEIARESMRRWNEQALPAIVVQVGGTLTTERHGPKYRVRYACHVAAIVSGQSRQNTRWLCGIYTAAIVGALVQNANIGGAAEGCEWVDTSYDLIGEERSRSIMAGIVAFDIAVGSVVDVSQGPDMPLPTDPTSPVTLTDWGQTVTIEIDLEDAPPP
jgi:hypothetical protein